MKKAAQKLTHWTLRRIVPHRWTVRRGRGLLHLGFCLNHRISRFSPFLRVAGDEYAAMSLGRALAAHCPDIGSWALYDAKETERLSADVLVVFWPDYPLVKRAAATQVLWLQNGGWASHIPRLQEGFDIVFCASQRLCERFAGLRYLPITSIDPVFYRPLPRDPRFACQVGFIGNCSAEGRPMAHAARYMLPATELDFRIWGSGWEQAEPPILRRFAKGRLAARYGPIAHNACDILLSYHSLPQREDDMPSGRVFDALACEAFTISDHMPSLELLGDYLVFTTGGDDLRDKLRYYLAHPEERTSRMRGARAFLLAHHSYAARAKVMAGIIGLRWAEEAAPVEEALA